MSFSEAEARIRRLMARLAQDEHRMDDVQDKILKARQDIGAFNQVSFGGPTTTVTGKIFGCDFNFFNDYDVDDGYSYTPTWLAGSTVQFIGSTTGHDYGTFTATDGTFSANVAFNPAADPDVKAIVTGPSPRFVSGQATIYDLTTAGTATIFPAPDPSVTSLDLGLLSATIDDTDYYAFDYTCRIPWPIYKTLNFDSTNNGTGTITYGSYTVPGRTPSFIFSSACISATSVAVAAFSCAPVDTILRLCLETELNLYDAFKRSGSCPDPAATCGGDVPNFTAIDGAYSAATKTAIPGNGTDTKLDLLYHRFGNAYFSGPTDTTRIWES